MMTLTLMMRGFATFWGKHRIIATIGRNIILSEAKNIISPQGDASMMIYKACVLIYLQKYNRILSGGVIV